MEKLTFEQRAKLYQQDMKKRDEAITRALEYYQAGDLEMAAFYYNGGKGYERRARRY